MGKKEYLKLEEHIANQFKPGTRFRYNQTEYHILNLDDVGKPRPVGSGGECKTDVYVAAKDDNGKKIELKISVKRRDSNEFQENKVTAKKAEAYFGNEWAGILTNAIDLIKLHFLKCQLVFPTGRYPTKSNSITLGWKLEITNKERNLSVKPNLDEDQIKDFVYKGTNQPESKRNAAVNGRIVPDSGIAYFLIKTEEHDITSARDVIDQMIPIDDMDIEETFLVFTANNYRTDVQKADGKRSLAVSIKWQANNGKIFPCFIFDEPLQHTGEKDMANYLVKALKEIGFCPPCNLPQDFVEKYVGTPKIIKE